jgi:Na+/H+-dicarboxylate symporter
MRCGGIVSGRAPGRSCTSGRSRRSAWVLILTPIGVFAFSLALALETGGAAAGLLGTFVLIQCVAMLAATGLLYPLSALAGRVPIAAFARAVAPGRAPRSPCR